MYLRTHSAISGQQFSYGRRNKITECHGANPGTDVYIHNSILSYFRITMVHSNAVAAYSLCNI